MECSRDTRSLDAPLLKELLSRSSCTSTSSSWPQCCCPKLHGVANFYSGWPSLSLWFGSKVKQWSIGIYRYLTPLRQVTALLTDQLLKIIYGRRLMRVGYCKVYRSCFRTLGAKVLEIFVLMIRHFHRKERKFLERLLPRNESSTGANVPRNESSWNIRSWETKVPWNESSTGAKVLSMVFSLPGTKVQRNEKAWNPGLWSQCMSRDLVT